MPKVEFQVIETHKMQRQTTAQKGSPATPKTVGDVVRESRKAGYAPSQKGGSKTVMDVIKASRKPNAAEEYANVIAGPGTNYNDSAAGRHALLGLAERGGAIDPIKLLEFEHQQKAQQVKPTKEDVSKCGGGVSGYIAAWNKLNR
jgi:hypothetical protein